MSSVCGKQLQVKVLAMKCGFSQLLLIVQLRDGSVELMRVQPFLVQLDKTPSRGPAVSRQRPATAELIDACSTITEAAGVKMTVEKIFG